MTKRVAPGANQPSERHDGPHGWSSLGGNTEHEVCARFGFGWVNHSRTAPANQRTLEQPPPPSAAPDGRRGYGRGVTVPVPAVDESDAALALDLALGAGELTLDWFDRPDLAVDEKADGTPVTAADRAAETYIRDRLADERPDDALVGEEHGSRPGRSGRRWVVDPIDGTKSFTRGVPLYATLVALDDEHGPAVGVIHLPALDETVWAVRGGGCWWNGEACAVTPRSSAEGLYVMTSAVDHWPRAMLHAVLDAGMTLRTWGDAYGYALVATGRADAMVDPIVSVWDVAPMPVILAEAGGRFTDLAGHPRTEGGSGLATNGVVHEEMLRLLNHGR